MHNSLFPIFPLSLHPFNSLTRVDQHRPGLVGLLFFVLLYAAEAKAQQSILYGTVTDRETGETLLGVNLLLEDSTGTTTDLDGKYRLALDPDRQRFTVSYLGYESQNRTVSLMPGEERQLDLQLISKTKELAVMVISTSQYEKSLEETSVSIDVLPSRLIANTNSVTLNDVLQRAPGVYLLDGQANIRGGTGFTYGAGSRVLLVLDDQPMLTADRGDAKWAFIPMENVEQIEVIKGASSVLYGASALNGVIHVRTVWPGSKPETGVEVYTGVYGRPDSADRQWWDFPPYTAGASLWHRRKFEQMDLVLGAHGSRELTHLQGQENTRARLHGKLRFRPKKNDNLSYGLGFMGMYNDESSYLIWSDEDSGAYKPFGGTEAPLTTLLDWKYAWLSLDPFLTAFDKAGATHRVKGRLYNNYTTYPDTNGGSWLSNIDYRYLKPFFKSVNVTTGLQGFYFRVRDGNLGAHTGILGGVYFQVDKEFFNRLQADFGFRMEFYDTDSATGTGRPILKAGLNYQASPTVFLRASFGQGYRFPSLVERYSSTNVGALRIYPNDTLKPEYGWNGELGLKRTITAGNWQGYADVAVYWTEYFDMSEFVFDNWGGPGAGGLGFRTINISRARMLGSEWTVQGSGTIGKVQLNLIGGYNYVYPADLTADSSNRNAGVFLSNAVRGFGQADSAFLSGLLKYRFRHMARLDAEVVWRKWRLGADLNFYSYMEKIDPVFEDFGIPPGIPEFREAHDQGDLILGTRLAFAPTENTSIAVLVRNATDREYALRVGKLDAPRNFRLQYRMTL